MSSLPFSLATPPKPPDGIDLRCCDVAEVLADLRGAALVHIDPPWTYDNAGTRGNAEDEYGLLDMSAIVAHVDAAYDCAADDAYLALWTTWPKLFEWRDASASMRWTYKTGAAWGKTGGLGVGFHFRGDSEPLLLYVKGNPRPRTHNTSNLHLSDRTAHSEKPEAFLRSLVRAFTSSGETVLELYAGLAPMARACLAEGRRYVGAEIDPSRHAIALSRLREAARPPLFAGVAR
jgi:N6-adenosine-specific RNA methylase IME4